LRPIRAFPRPHRHRPQCHPPFSHGVLIAFPSFLIASTAWDRGRGASETPARVLRQGEVYVGSGVLRACQGAHGCSWPPGDGRRAEEAGGYEWEIFYIGIDLLGYVGLAGLDSAKTPSHARNLASFGGERDERGERDGGGACSG
jgi:hypothetical protein